MVKTKNPDKCLQRLMKFKPVNDAQSILRAAFHEKAMSEKRKELEMSRLPTPVIKQTHVSPLPGPQASEKKGIFNGKGPLGLFNNIYGRIVPGNGKDFQRKESIREDFPSNFMEPGGNPDESSRSFYTEKSHGHRTHSVNPDARMEKVHETDALECERRIMRIIEKLENEPFV